MLIGSDQFTLIVGLGKTGMSCARYLAASGARFGAVDTRIAPPNLAEFQRLYPEVPVECGPLNADTLKSASRLVVSPGVALAEPAIQAAAAAGVELLGDIDLFCLAVKAPIVAITGSNAKSTVTSLVGAMAARAGVDAGVGGNLGTPVLDMLEQGEQALYVLELSSFQLETTEKLRAEVATVLNVSPDHMDRYADLSAYHRAKQRIYRGCRQAVFNRDDTLTQPLLPDTVPQTSFGLGQPDLGAFGVREHEGASWLVRGLEPLMPLAAMKMRGQHNVANALAALALGQAVKLPMDAMLATLREFAGLRHRCQWVRALDGVDYVNDSKGTNVGATLAAINGLGPDCAGKLILIAGGDGKGAAFDDLKQPMAQYGRAAVLIGTDAPRIDAALDGACQVVQSESLAAAVGTARALAQPGDLVLLSPACASFDMFKGFEDRGDQFVAAVEGLR
ncbi:UDP-N-acetylmuramoyl-L-alanine--D-glutamate ligase [Motiliproteus sediminis]|uniref:UDP-N-acetylmuramoyl-L-alanine--D-glutamate ligase n=1 Tax=Motiliproteus sediminis TaxID=1468178 RepID=UPI001AEF84CD|nr:UDP-N-acetylmuramoyl-L-alanine--D-glutamate ligase [Motiliproteus sediminis]